MDIATRLAGTEIVIIDSAMGTELQRRGVALNHEIWSVASLLSHPHLVREIHVDYIRAGAEIQIAATYNTAPHVVNPSSFEITSRELTATALRLVREGIDVAEPAHPVWIAGSISTTVESRRKERLDISMLRDSYTEHTSAMTDYVREGLVQAERLGNRGPLRVDAHGRPQPDILDAYREYGCYVLEGAIGARELEDLRADMEHVFERAPVRKGARVDKQGRRAFGLDYALDVFLWATPLSDPVGGTTQLAGRHPTKMSEPRPPANSPHEIIFNVMGMFQLMDSALRLYGHPRLLAIAESLNGPDFTPFGEAIFVKQPGLGTSVAWHQDGTTHWNSPDWNEDIHGFNFQAQLFASSPASCLWVLPGSHKLGKLDIKTMVEQNGSDRLPDAIPLWCNPGDITIVNRHQLHCSFANTSPDRRVSLTFGFHRRSSVLGQRDPFVEKPSDAEVYNPERIFARSSVIQVAIDARSQRFPDEMPYRYLPFVGREGEFRFNEQTRETIVKNYNLNDLQI